MSRDKIQSGLNNETILIWNSGVFDAEFYRLIYKDLHDTSIDLAEHYLTLGVREGRDPHPLFSTTYYLDHSPDVADSGQNPLIHYLQHGGRERRSPSPSFDTPYYIAQLPSTVGASVNPLVHYLTVGWKSGLRPNANFDRDWYLAQYADAAHSGIDPLSHYLRNLRLSDPKNRRPSPHLDFRGHPPPTGFVERVYRWLHPDVSAAIESGVFTSGADHWLRSGAFEGRAWRPDLPSDFDEAAYLRHHPDISRAVADGVFTSGADHWLQVGAIEGRRAWSSDSEDHAKSFDEAAYLAANPDVAIAVTRLEFENGFSHWRLRGRDEGRRITHAPPARARREPAGAGDCSSEVSMANGFQPYSYARHYKDVGDSFGGDPEQLLAHWLNSGSKEGRIGFGLRQYERRIFTSAFDNRADAITMYGFFDAPSGLGAAARGYRDALIAAGYSVDSITIAVKDGRFETTPDVREASVTSGYGLRNKVNLFHLNADMVQSFFWDGRTHLLNDSFNVGLWVWELAHFRSDWISSFGAFDEIWTPSEFCRRAFAASSPIPVTTIPYVVDVERAPEPAPRSHFRLPQGTFVFGSIFDVGSVVERKNPDLLIKAFIEAFGDNPEVTLVVKYHSGRHYPDRVAQLHALAAGRANIVFLGRVFDPLEIASLKEHIDCLVSPHRSEGFGLNIAESMGLGKAVLATDYSGSADFLSAENGYPLEYKLAEIEKPLGPYPVDALWADVDVPHLAAQMRSVVADPAEARWRAERAVVDIKTNYSTAAIARRMRGRLDSLGVFDRAAAILAGKVKRGVHAAYRDINADGPKISVVVPVFDIDPKWLKACIESVRRQSYTNWELVLHDDGSQRQDTLSLMRQYVGLDQRIKVSFGHDNVGIAAATNAAIELSSGQFIAFLDNDDELSADALEAMADAIVREPQGDLFYSDEDKIDESGAHCDHYCKPDWSPEHLESSGYLLHLAVIRRSLLLKLNGLRSEFSGAQDFDLSLRASRWARKVVHVPKILYHWRMIPGSAAAVVDAKPQALSRATQALQNHLDASGRDAVVAPGMLTGLFRVRDRLPSKLPVTLVIPTDNRGANIAKRGEINLFDNFVESILSKTTTSCEMRLLAVDNGNLTERQRRHLEQNNGRVISYPGPRSPFSMAKKINFTLPHVTTEQLIILNDDMEVVSPGWVDALMELSQRPSSGVVGARLLYPDDRIQHCGMVFGINGHVAHVFHQYGVDQVGYNGYTHIIRNYLAVTGACMATKMSLFNEVGGFDEDFAVDYNDTDFCLRVHAAGYRNIYTPFATLYHFEGTTAVRSQPAPREHQLFVERWKSFMETDPYYNPNLTRERYDFSLGG